MPGRPSSKKTLHIGPVSQLPLEGKKEKSRNGIILYTIHGGERYFLFGFDTQTLELTDFGGKYKRQDETRVRGALREFHEETMNCFEEISEDQLQQCIGITDGDNLIIFVPVDVSPADVCQAIEERVQDYYKKTEHIPEIVSVTWVRENDLLNCITRKDSSNTIYGKVAKLLRSAVRNPQNFIHQL